MVRRLLGSLSLVLAVSVGSAAAQSDVRYADEPTGGLYLPTLGLAGERDATTVVTNAAGMMQLSSWHFGFALELEQDDDATSAGPGAGAYLALPWGGFAFGLGVEWLRPSRLRLAPDPGSPTRLSLSSAIGGDKLSMGFSTYRYFDDDALPLAGLWTSDLSFSLRAGVHFAAAYVVRDLFSPTVAAAPVQRRHELELAARPLATDRLELGVGGRIGEVRGDVDAWFRGTLKLTRGVYLRGEAQTLSLHELAATPGGSDTRDRREYRFTAGLEVSVGGAGNTVLGSLNVNDDGDARFGSGVLVSRLSGRAIPSVLSSGKRLEKINLGGPVGQRGVTRVVTYLKFLERDDNVVGVIVHLNGFAAGWSTSREVRSALADLKASGKKVYAYLVAGTTRQYYVASVADKIWVDPIGGIRLQGFAGTTMYYKGLFDRLGVKAQFEKIEEFKSAPESWTRSGPSGPAFEQRRKLFDGLYRQLLDDVAAGRGIAASKVAELIDNGPYTSGDLEANKLLVDGILAPDDLKDAIAKDMGRRYPVSRRARVRPERWDYPEIAIVYINGDIVDGQSQTIPLLGRRLVGGKSIAGEIARAAADPKVKAIVLRINSPGGTVIGAELITRQIKKAAKKKPIICSMGDIAASGGYMVAAPCLHVYAGRNTITGSIGIFAGKFDVSRLLSLMGLSWTVYKRGERADAESFYRPFTDEERKQLKLKLRYMYDRFRKHVADGRGLTMAEVDAVGRGQVFTGTAAKERKLIDEFGGIYDAITAAKLAGGLSRDTRVKLRLLPERKTNLLSRLLGGRIPFLRSGDDHGGANIDEWRASELTLLEQAGAPVTSELHTLLVGVLPGAVGNKILGAIPGSVWVAPGEPQARLPFSIVWGQ